MTSNGASFHYQQFLGDFKKGSFIVSGLMFRSLIHFEFIFVYLVLMSLLLAGFVHSGFHFWVQCSTARFGWKSFLES